MKRCVAGVLWQRGEDLGVWEKEDERRRMGEGGWEKEDGRRRMGDGDRRTSGVREAKRSKHMQSEVLLLSKTTECSAVL